MSSADKTHRFRPHVPSALQQMQNTDNAVNLFLFLVIVGIIIFVVIESIRSGPESQTGENGFEDVMLDRTSPGMVKLREGSIRTYQETVKETGGTTTKPPQPAGGPGNTLAPVVAPTLSPDFKYSSTNFKWDQINQSSTKVWIGLKMNGPYRKLKEFGYFVLLQTPPPSNKEIYGDFCVFVEGGKIGIRVAGNSHITMQQFDFNHKLTYMIEVALTFKSMSQTRVDLLIDGANTGHGFTVYNQNMVEKIRALPGRMQMMPQVSTAWLQQNKTPLPNNWGSIVEKVVNQ